MKILPLTILACLMSSGCASLFGERQITSSERLADQNAAKVEAAADKVRQEDSAARDRAEKERAAKELADKQTADEKARSDEASKAALKARDKAIAQASSNLGPLSDVVVTKGLPDIGTGIGEQKKAIDKALNVPPAEYPAPTVSVAQLLSDARAAVESYKTNAATLQGEADAAKKAALIAETKVAVAEQAAKEAGIKAQQAIDLAEAKRREVDAANVRVQEAEKLRKEAEAQANAEARNAWLLKVGMGALSGIGTIAVIILRSGAGGPIGSLLSNLLTPVLAAKNKAQEGIIDVAHTALASADVGRAAIAAVESRIASVNPAGAAAITTALAAATAGRVSSFEDLFKMVAKSHVTDLGTGKVSQVANLLTQLRDTTIDTTGGIPDTVKNILG
jgi:chemotaxis protein histidine kinase CheA